jgi:lipopolysaccharide/colanic/teichoic acid biosynthesis glycosyltransferase
MSFAGSRTHRRKEIEVNGNGHAVPLTEMPGYAERHMVRPGVTGIAQIYLPRHISRRNKFIRSYLHSESVFLA